MTGNRLKIAIVIPVYNEERILRTTCKTLSDILANLPHETVAVFVDDGSTDGSWTILVEEIHKNCKFGAVQLSRNFGHDAALFAGFESVSADAYITMDADGEHPFDRIPDIVNFWLKSDCDVVNAVKAERPSRGAINSIGLKAFNWVLNRNSVGKFDNATEFKLLSRRAVETALECRDFHIFYRALVPWIGYKQVDFEFQPGHGLRNGSSWRLGSLIRFAGSGMVMFSSFPIAFLFYLAAASFLGALLLSAVVIIRTLGGESPQGIPTVIILILVNTGMTSFGMFVLGLYTHAGLQQSIGRPRLIVQQAVGAATQRSEQ